MVKIVIIGAGISGLSTYLFLRKHLLRDRHTEVEHERNIGNEIEIKIYEAYDIHAPKFNATLFDTSAGGVKGEQGPTLPADETQPIFTPQAIGSAIGISKNGLSVLSRLEDHDDDEIPTGASHKLKSKRGPSIMHQLATHGHPIDCWQISTARGFTIVDVKLRRAHNREPASPNADAQMTEGRDGTKQTDLYRGIMIARQSCWEILRDRVLDIAPDTISKKRVTDVEIGDKTSLNIITFEDGSRELADLVIGADGLRSVLRRAMFRGQGEDQASQAQRSGDGAGAGARKRSWIQVLNAYLPFSRPKTPTVTKPDFISPHYEGLVGVGGFIPSSVLQSAGHKPGTMAIVFGPNGFFGYGYLSSAVAAVAEEEQPLSPPTPGSGSGQPEPGPHPEHTTSSVDADPTIGPLSVWWSTFSSPTPYPYAKSDSGTYANTQSAHSVRGTGDTQNSVPTQPPTQTQTQAQAHTFDKSLALAALLGRHSTWKNATVTAILKYVSTHVPAHEHSAAAAATTTNTNDRALDACYPTWTTPELPTWTKNGRAVLVGDAAHALRPSSGQGACQALEDAEALALFLRRYLVGSSSSAALATDAAALTPRATPSAPLSISTSTPASADPGCSCSRTPPPPAPAPASSLVRPSVDVSESKCDTNTDTDTDTGDNNNNNNGNDNDSNGLRLQFHTHDLSRALAAYHAFRAPRVHKVHERSRKMAGLKSDMNVVMEYLMYFSLWVMTWSWLSWCLARLGVGDWERYNEELFGYDLPAEVESFLEREDTKDGARVMK
ncbi:hypothetical protein G647_06692 [Cladophialophora carrionii CBS 160.54]|uniref:FAD-binding domain-containing protein n=1 Tax=Cladophialophora carrionii CBS 160.54 TaxID=1279043 RepID=V9D7I3_9EURO|nr:uncharacterized protein G647_06692 [Cladophialophora carrionii CBS 160.54]ETI22616.1 hypothetical protein G647_06692 [Cladophialophora carrionii CBS 160.54]